MLGVFKAVDTALDRTIGAANLPERVRRRLLAEQHASLLQITPATIVSSSVTTILLLAVCAGTELFTVMLAWAALLGASNLASYFAWRRNQDKPIAPVGPSIVRRAAIWSFFFGMVWGAVPVLVMPLGDTPSQVAALVSVAGMLYVTGIALAVVPQAAIAFALPIVAGSIWAIYGMDKDVQAGVFGLLMLLFVCALAFVGLRSVRGFVRRIDLESTVRSQKDIISLLLKEFEAKGSDWLWSFDAEGRIRNPSARFEAAAQSGPMDGKDFVEFLRATSAEAEPIVAEIALNIAAREPFSDVQIRIERDGAEHWWTLTGKPAVDDFGAYVGYIGTAADITSEKVAERKINFLAHNDALTGLLNRAKFTEHLKQCVARLERYGSPFSILFLDLDQFKLVNDSRGHLIGDQLLIQVARRIRSTLREADTAARLGGDEFAIILNNNCTAEETAALASRLVRIVSEPYAFDDEMLSIGVSIGIAMAPINGIRPDQLLRNADLALYRAKAEGRGVYRFFESQMDSDVRERRILELELREALKDGEFMLYYQPLVSADSKAPTGFEALVRWNHPIRGVVPPAEFIPIAEQSGLIKQIGDWTIHEACAAAMRWPNDLIVAVNLSPKHFQLSDIAAVVRDALAATGLPPHRLELEITESLLIERPEQVVERLTEIKALGVTIAMDDFGTGYSSLSYLLKFPFDKIKIDKSFVTASSDDTVARDILRTIASLGRTLKIRITAEGVETSEQVEFLRDIACHQLQGYYFARPFQEADLAAYFLQHFDREVLKPTRAEDEARAAG